MRILLIAGLALLAAPLAAAPRTTAKFVQPSTSALKNCPPTAAYHLIDENKGAKPRKLADLPPAHQFSAVYRTVNGCQVPLIVRYNVGG